jgi:hypothetical protein
LGSRFATSHTARTTRRELSAAVAAVLGGPRRVTKTRMKQHQTSQIWSHRCYNAPENQMNCRVSLDVVMGQRMAIFKTSTAVDKSLAIMRVAICTNKHQNPTVIIKSCIRTDTRPSFSKIMALTSSMVYEGSTSIGMVFPVSVLTMTCIDSKYAVKARA